MKESFIDCGRAIVANDQTAKVSEPGKGALHFPTAPIAAQRSTVLGARLAAIPTMRRDQFDPACRQPLAQWIAVVGAIGNHTLGFLTWPSTAMSPAHTNRRERFFREPDFVGRCRVKLLSQRNTLAVDHHHPLRALAPLGFSNFRAPFLAGTKLPSRNDSLQSSCSRWFSSGAASRSPVKETRRANPASERRCVESTESLRALCGRWLAVCHHAGAWAASGARDRSFPIGRRSAVDRIAPSVLPWRCCPNLSRVFAKLTINLSARCI